MTDWKQRASTASLSSDDIRKLLAGQPSERIGPLLPEFRRASVLVPLLSRGGDWSLLLTRRTEDVEHHKGQISFPGGAMEEGESPAEAAVRETWEEIAVDPSAIETLGLLDDIWTPSGFVITPVGGFVRDIESIVPNPAEVSRVFVVPIHFFAEPLNETSRLVHVNGYSRMVYYYDYEGENIWGATAFIIRDLLRRLGLAPAEDPDTARFLPGNRSAKT